MENRKIKSRAIFINKGKILLCYNPKYNYYYFPGGSSEEGESSAETLRREILEELNAEIINIKQQIILKEIGENNDETITIFTADFANPQMYNQSILEITDMPDIKAFWISKDDIKNGKAKILPEFNYLELLSRSS